MVTIARRFNGPDSSGNGGYVCGLLAREHAAGALGATASAPVTSTPVTSTLRLPPPLETPLVWERHDDATHLVTTGGALVGTAQAGSFDQEPPPAPTSAEAEQGLAAYQGHDHHPFDRCFTCGTAREEGDGLRIFTGPIEDGRTAAAWTPHPDLATADGVLDEPTMWAALDCPGGWAADFTRQVMVLGRMTAQVFRPVAAGESVTATGLLRHREGRKMLTATALHDGDGELLGRAEQVWIEVAPHTFG